ncbi:MAG: ACT domain-containing protein [Actinomyces urogenitalis]|uniref:ACT domain-containing protein n=1 Tax=Actinomyces urogenitalis TaxID=103621 RepID=UPI002A7FE88E|nr:ACT domain-containing protein [Actinomyces urogenitalis]MDY3678215.1 ACT domain-containing protein [Actinomyces urogenitalis]
MSEPIADLSEILASLVVTDRGPYVYLRGAVPADLPRLAEFWEDEGCSVVVPADAAAAHGDQPGPGETFHCLTLEVHTALTGVGLTALVSGVLAEAGIACNVVAGYYHDHFLVPADRADQALALLRALRSA